MRLSWAQRSKRDIASIIAHISMDNPTAALEQAQRIERRAADLIDYPLIGRIGRLRGTRELVVVGTPYLLIYRLAAKKVDIIRVLHGAQEWPRRKGRR